MLAHATRGRTAIAVVLLLGGLNGCGRTGRGSAGTDEETKPEPRAPNAATSDEWAGQTVTRMEELFEGRFPGVQVFRTPGGIAVRIRGSTSLMGSNEPLYVVDGQIIEPGPDGALVGLNPADIAKIEVLKDIGATAVYGGRGANGVIVIKTRRAE